MIETPQFDALHRIVFERGSDSVYAVLDGATINQLPERLRAAGCDYACLFSGALDPLLEAAAPHLVRLRTGDRFTDSVLHDGWNDHWGIVMRTAAGIDLYALRQHLRRYLRVSGPGGHAMFFRFYDPRAFRVVIPAFDNRDRRGFFGPIESFVVESPVADVALCYERDGHAEGRRIALGASASGAR